MFVKFVPLIVKPIVLKSTILLETNKTKSISYLIGNIIIRNVSTMTCKISVCQMTSTNDKSRNLAIVERLVAESAKNEAQMVFLPEACDFVAENAKEALELAEDLKGPTMTTYRRLAKSSNVWLSIGGFHELSDDKSYNCHVLINNAGDICQIYRKIHLFDVEIPEKGIRLRESEITKAGGQICTAFNTPAGKLALSICYDLRFPELALIQRQLGAEILTYPSAFTSLTGAAHWEILLRARAVENQCFVVAAAQYGFHNAKRSSFGQAMVVDPWGKILAQCQSFPPADAYNLPKIDESCAIATIDLDVLKRVRSEMPLEQHRRHDLYRLQLTENKMSIDDNSNFNFADKIISGHTVFYLTTLSYAFTNIRCVVPGHVLVSSRKVAKRLENLSQPEVADLFETAVLVQKVMEQIHGTQSSTIVVQDGIHAGQTVPHVHVHILPRKPGDFDRNDDIYDVLSKHDRDDNPKPIRDISEMISEAKELRKYFY